MTAVRPEAESRRDGLRLLMWLLRDTVVAWQKDNPALISAGLSFFAVFSVAPLMIIGVSLAHHLFQITIARELLLSRIADFSGPDAAQSVGYLIRNVQKKFQAITFVSALFLLWGGTRIFSQLQRAIDMIWGFEAFPDGVHPSRSERVRFHMARTFRAVLMVAAFCGVLFVFFVIDIGLNGFGRLLLEYFPPAEVYRTLPFWSHVCSFGVITASFALVYKFLPNARINWSDVWVGAIFTSVLLATGRFAIALYFQHANLASVYGAAGSVLATLIWIYFSMNVLLLGAEFTWVYAHRDDARARRQHADLRPSA